MIENLIEISYVFYLLIAAGLLLISFKSLRGGFSFLSHFKNALREKEPLESSPHVSILIPVRGVDEGLKENINAIINQDYPSFDVTIICDDTQDPALAELSELIESQKLHLKITEKVPAQSGKISKLIDAVSSLSEDTEVIVFADSDARPGSQWLRSLVEALEEEGIGASTGYRWFFSSSPSIATEIRSSWNASVSSVLGIDVNKNFCWGGSTAIKRKTFDSLRIADRWRGALSDDYVLTSAIHEAGLGIAFEPMAMSASVENCSFGGMVEFTTRQMKITRVYAPRFFFPALIGSSIHCVGVIWSIAILLVSSDELMRFSAALALSLVWGMSVGKAGLRVSAMGIVMPEHSEKLIRQRKWQTILWSVTPFVFLYNCIVALFSREVTWRGTRYRMISPNKTEVL